MERIGILLVTSLHKGKTMTLLELEDQDLKTAYYDPLDDKYNVRNPTQTRVPVLTLKAINRLKRLRAVQALEFVKKQDLLKTMYGAPAEEGGLGAPGMGF